MNDVKIIDQTFHFGEDGRRAKGGYAFARVDSRSALRLGVNVVAVEAALSLLDYVATCARGET